MVENGQAVKQKCIGSGKKYINKPKLKRNDPNYRVNNLLISKAYFKQVLKSTNWQTEGLLVLNPIPFNKNEVSKLFSASLLRDMNLFFHWARHSIQSVLESAKHFTAMKSFHKVSFHVKVSHVIFLFFIYSASELLDSTLDFMPCSSCISQLVHLVSTCMVLKEYSIRRESSCLKFE